LLLLLLPVQKRFFFLSVSLFFFKKKFSLSLSTPPTTLLHQLDDVDDLALRFGSSDGFADGGSAAPAASVPTASARHGRRSSGKLRCFLTRSLYSLLLAARRLGDSSTGWLRVNRFVVV